MSDNGSELAQDPAAGARSDAVPVSSGTYLMVRLPTNEPVMSRGAAAALLRVLLRAAATRGLGDCSHPVDRDRGRQSA